MKPFSPNILIADDGCWIWTGTKVGGGYGVTGPRGSTQRVHRIAYTLEHGPIPPNMMVCHSCDNPSCCNPDHLWLGDNRANQADAARKGRQRGQSQTHCINGHEYTPANTYWRPGKVASRDCRICIRERVARYLARKAA